jgi:hypothetical protein
MKFKKGDKVIVVRDGKVGSETNDWLGINGFVLGNILTIARVESDSSWCRIKEEGKGRYFIYHPDHFELIKEQDVTANLKQIRQLLDGL